MINAISNRLTNNLIKNNVIDDEDSSIYAYGIEITIAYLLNFFTMLMISVLMGMVMEYILFIAFLLPLKGYTGGYHAHNYKVCYFASCLIVGINLVVMKYVFNNFQVNINVLVFLISLCGVLIYILGPVEDKNKPISKSEFIYYEKKIRNILLIEYIIVLILAYFNLTKIVFIIGCCLMVNSLISIAGHISNKKRRGVI